jgi:hypothetical protein
MAAPRPLLVIGLDLREDRRTPPAAWDAERRDQFLLRPDVARPLSLDPTVWPCASDAWLEKVVGASSDLATTYGSLRIDTVRTLLGREEFHAQPGTLLAVGVRAVFPYEAMVLGRERQAPLARRDAPGDAPRETGAEWDDRPGAAGFVAALNDHHLFRTETDAGRFLAWRASVSPEAGVWRVVHLWDVPRAWLLAERP